PESACHSVTSTGPVMSRSASVDCWGAGAAALHAAVTSMTVARIVAFNRIRFSLLGRGAWPPGPHARGAWPPAPAYLLLRRSLNPGCPYGRHPERDTAAPRGRGPLSAR